LSIYQDSEDNSEIDIIELVSILKNNFKFIFSTVFIITAITAAISLTFDNIYRSEAVVAFPNSNNSSSLSSVVGSSSSLLGSLSGNLLPDLGANDENVINLMRSKDFFKTLYLKEDFLIYLMASKKYDPVSFETTIDPKKYDTKNKKWVRKVNFPKKVKPSLQEAHKYFMESFNIVEDDKNNIIILSYDHKSALITKNNLKLFIDELNDYVRNRDIKKAQKGIEYIQSKLNEEKISEIRNVLAAVMEKDIQTLSLAEKSEEFVLEIIDSPYVPEKKLKPRRSIICLFAAFIATIFCISLVLILNLYDKKIVFKRFFYRIDSV
jgi:uncharacterized protein involved in exopolysaccharide biosynthesis